jgi:peptide deformylase
MAIRKIARMGHPVLRQTAVSIPPELVLDPDVQRLIDDMLETVDDASGAGLAAPQVHESVRIVVLELSAERGMEVWINPELTVLNAEGEPAENGEEVELAYTFEGCLSVPGLRGLVGRPAALSVQGLRRDGSPFRLQLRGFPAVVAQHECDHLDGVLYVDKVEPETLTFLEEHRKYGLSSAGLEE